MKEGTKTTQAVTLASAQLVFNKLVGEKTKNGYRDVTAAQSDATPAIKPVETQPLPTDDARKQAILNRLDRYLHHLTNHCELSGSDYLDSCLMRN